MGRKASYKYGSVPEAVTAIELLYNKLSFIPQKQVDKYRVDFAIPKINAVLEVDGSIYHNGKNKSAYRDKVIYEALDKKWRIIHIPAELINIDRKNIIKLLKTYTNF